MLTSIQFEDEFLFDADKIRDEVANGMLPSKCDSKLVVANSCPQFALGGSKFFA